MKKILAIMLALCMLLCFAACTANEETPNNTEDKTQTNQNNNDEGTGEDEVKVMTYAEYEAAELDAEVVVECYVQATQSWWEDKITVYAQDQNGAYFLYELACSEADAEKLVPGTKIRVTGTKGEWSGEVEIMDGTFEFVEGGDNFLAEPKDVTDLLGTDDLIKDQNKLVCFKGLTVKKVEYKNGEPGDDIYVTVNNGEADFDFCVERYLTDPDTDVYKAVGELAEGDKVDVTGFLYWYEGPNTHITEITKAE